MVFFLFFKGLLVVVSSPITAAWQMPPSSGRVSQRRALCGPLLPPSSFTPCSFPSPGHWGADVRVALGTPRMAGSDACDRGGQWLDRGSLQTMVQLCRRGGQPQGSRHCTWGKLPGCGALRLSVPVWARPEECALCPEAAVEAGGAIRGRISPRHPCREMWAVSLLVATPRPSSWASILR